MHDPSLQAVRRAAAFESTVLENGLTVRVHTMPGFTGVHAVYGTCLLYTSPSPRDCS